MRIRDVAFSRLINYGVLISLLLVLNACDAILMLSYVVENKTNETQRISIEGFPKERRIYSTTVDTVIDLKPNERVTIGMRNGVGFPWETKKLFKAHNGRQNFNVITGDSTFKIDNSDKYWRYKKGVSYFKITDKRLNN